MFTYFRDTTLVVFVLTMAQKDREPTQKDVVKATAQTKDVVSKLVGSLVQAGLLTQERQRVNSRFKRLYLTNAGRALLSRIRETLQPPRLPKPSPEKKVVHLSFFD
jgi:DNA-binding MarR family transcriptional regulator